MRRLIFAISLLMIPCAVSAQPALNQTRGMQLFYAPIVINPGGQYIGTTGVATGPIYLPDGTAAAPAAAFTSHPSTGFYGNAGGTQPSITIGGVVVANFDSNSVEFANNILLSWSSTSVATGSGDLFLSREAPAVLKLGLDAAGVTPQTLKGPDRITSDGVGGNLTIAGGRNRGASAGGSLFFQVSPAAAAGVTGTLGTVFTLSPTALTITTIVAPAASGQRFLCISTTGVVTSSATACVGT